MDIPRPNVARERRKSRIIFAFAGVIVVVAIVALVTSLKPLPDTVQQSQRETENVTVNKQFGFKVTKTGRIDGYFSYVVENSAGEKYLVFSDYVVPLSK